MDDGTYRDECHVACLNYFGRGGACYASYVT